MAYHKRNLLLKIVEIQNIVLREKARGLSQKYIYDAFIKKTYFISYSAFNEYLARNAKRELEDYDSRKIKDKRQLRLF